MRYFFITIIGVSFLFGGITKELKERLNSAGDRELIEVVIHVKGYPNLMRLGKGKYKEKVELLRKVAKETQKGIIDFLRAKSESEVAEFRSFWVDNTIYLKATKNIIREIAKRKEVRWMDISKTYHIIGDIRPVSPDVLRAVAWGVRKIWADSVWLNLGITGQGVIVGIMDTGCDVNHPALQGKWTGYWFDGVNGQTSPYDDHGHGTHVTGTILGGDGPGPFGEDIGVAYGANFCSAKAFDQNGSGQDPWIRACFQWFASIKADSGVDVKLVSNSWGSSANDTTYWDPCMTWRSLDIIPVFAAGNEGPNPSTLRNPGSFPIVIGVGATDSLDNMASFSSRGPAPNQPPWNDTIYWPRDDWNLIKPNISAPGVDVYSAAPGGGYQLMSGTSMATPHVSGVLALMFEKNPSLDFYSVYTIILDNADLPPQGAPYPNNDYGWGRINAYRAVNGTPPQAEHNIGAITFLSPSSDIIEQYIYLYPIARFRNWGQNKEYNIYVHCDVYENSNLIYSNSTNIDSLDVNDYVDVSFDSVLVGAVGSRYDLVAYCVHNLDTIPDDDTTRTTTWAAHYYKIIEPGCSAWKLPNTDTTNFPPPGDPSWIPATPEEIDSIAYIDQTYWVTSGATDTAFQDLQLYGFNIVEPETLITKFRINWIGHFGGVHNRVQMRLWNTGSNSYVMKSSQQQFTGDATLSTVLDDSAQTYIDGNGYVYINTAANTYVKSSCPLVFTWDGEKYNYAGDVILGGVIGLSFKNILGQNLYLPSDPDEYMLLNKDRVKEVYGRIKININEMQQEITYLDHVSLIAVDHPENTDIYPLEAYKLPPYKGLNIISSSKEIEFSVTDEKGNDLTEYIKEMDYNYVPFKRSRIKGVAREPYSIIIDLKKDVSSDNTYLFIQGTGVFIESGEVWPMSDRLRAEKTGLEVKFPEVEVWDGKKWIKIESCGLPAGYSKTLVYPLKKALEIGNKIKITYTTEVYIDKIWVSESENLDLKTFTLEPSEAHLHYYGVSKYVADDDRLPGEYSYKDRMNWEFVIAEGNYTPYGDVLDLLEKVDDRFVIMKTGDEISFEFNLTDLPDLPEGYTRDYILYVNGFYKPIRPGIAYAYTVEPLPHHKMGEKLAGDGLVYYPVNPAPTPLHALIFRIYSNFEYGIPFSLKDAITLISGYFDRYTLNPHPYDKEYLARNTRYAGHYYPSLYVDLPPHKNYEKVPLIKELPVQYASLPDNSLHSDFVEVIVVTSVPWVGVSEKGGISTSLRLFPNYPNPFKNKTTFKFSIPHKGRVTLKIFDITGREVNTVLNKVLEPGLHKIQWNAKDKYEKLLKPGTYIYHLEFEKKNLKGKFVLMK